jgi:Putative zinc-binding metallo-peptidase
MTEPTRFEADDDLPRELLEQRICDFRLDIHGGPLEGILARFEVELAEAGIRRLRPRYYLSDEWGVPDGTVAIGIPFYLADARLRSNHARRGVFVEGVDEADVLRYLRHEMGHVVNYAYRLHETEEWTRTFGPMDRPYEDDFRVVPFSPDFVRYLPGGYAQKHPDEDWAETFAVWVTPGLDWAGLYADAPGALAKLRYAARVLGEIGDREPPVAAVDLDGEVCELKVTVQKFYDNVELEEISLPRSLDGDLRALVAPHASAPPGALREEAAALFLQHRGSLSAAVYRWTGLFPERARAIIDHLTERARALGLTYLASEREEVLCDLACLLAALAMNHAHTGAYVKGM